MEDYYTISDKLNKIIKFNTIVDGLLELNDICNTIPNIKINEILDRYIDSIY